MVLLEYVPVSPLSLSYRNGTPGNSPKGDNPTVTYSLSGDV